MTTRRHSRSATHFTEKLILTQWALELFGITEFKKLSHLLADERLEGLDENNVHYFYHELVTRLHNMNESLSARLLTYEENIVRHTQRLNQKRLINGASPIVWKYYQYLSLLFTEIYLDHYFVDAPGLLKTLNSRIITLNSLHPEEPLAAFNEDADASSQLNKLAFWTATGSGKTLIMHVNILQYQDYIARFGHRRDLNRTILLTPNEGLSRQHLREFELAGIEATLFEKDAQSLFAGQFVEVIDIHKLRDEMGEKTVAVESFEGKNLILVDEGHRGASSGEAGTWMRFRNTLCEGGFSFEYSATFEQAVKGDESLTNQYARGILFDYSYPRFYADGFGKDYHILNIDAATQRHHREVYLVANLLLFAQQQRFFKDNRSAIRPFKIDSPLWIFVGGSVTKALSQRDTSDVVEILLFFDRYLRERNVSVSTIDAILKRGLSGTDGQNVFQGRFKYLERLGLSPSELYNDTLSLIFNAPGGGTLHVENIRAAPGEIALRAGDNEPFGVINVGDDAKLVRRCQEAGISVAERLFQKSLFDTINAQTSRINVLVGSRKFTEGWNSWRVSSMGLMNIGRTEGAQIIQLFGRGVRLKGFGFSLKRSNAAALPPGTSRPDQLELLETLNVFGIDADYMEQFREFLADEGLDEDVDVEVMVPTHKMPIEKELLMVRLPSSLKGVDTDSEDPFKVLGPRPTLAVPREMHESAQHYFRKNRIQLNWYPRLEALRSAEASFRNSSGSSLTKQHLTAAHISFLDLDQLYFEAEQFKADRGWWNLNIPRAIIAKILRDNSWYDILITADDLILDSFEKVAILQDIATTLIKRFLPHYYFYRKQEWEAEYIRYEPLGPDDANLISQYVVRTQESQGTLIRKLDGLSAMILEYEGTLIEKLDGVRAMIATGDRAAWSAGGLTVIWSSNHLYEPLLAQEEKVVSVSPAPLNDGERKFVEDLDRFWREQAPFFGSRALHLLRNLSRGHGVGFFEAGNFYPDFIMWLPDGDRKYVTFIDPKGMRHLGPQDPKVMFFERIKELEERLGRADVVLNSFLLATTSPDMLTDLWGMSKANIEAMNILFQDDRLSYIANMFNKIVGAALFSGA